MGQANALLNSECWAELMQADHFNYLAESYDLPFSDLRAGGKRQIEFLEVRAAPFNRRVCPKCSDNPSMIVVSGIALGLMNIALIGAVLRDAL